MIDVEAAARRLIEARQAGLPIDRLPPECRPATIDEAYAVQDRVSAGLGPIGGWKVGQSPDGSITCAAIQAADIHPSNRPLPAAAFHDLAVEIEFAFRLGRDLPHRAEPYGYAETAAAVSGFLPLIEVIGSRYADYRTLPGPEQLADAGGNGAFVLGPESADWRALDFQQQTATLAIDGTIRQAPQPGTHPAGDPVLLVVWLANHLAARSGGLKSGDVVTTGSLDGATPIAAGSAAEADFGRWGKVSVRFG